MVHIFRRSRPSPRSLQRGAVMLVELAIVAALSIGMATAKLWAQRQDALSDLRTAQGSILYDIGNGYNTYIVNHYSPLLSGTAIAGVANIYSPTIPEIQATGDLNKSYQTTAMIGGLPYVALLKKDPVGCSGSTCNITGLVCVNGSIKDPSTGAAQPLGDALVAVGADGLVSDDVGSSATLLGRNGSLSLANPLGNTAGTLCMQVGYNSSGFSQFVRKDGSVAMEGNFNLQGTNGVRHNVNNVATVNAQNIVTPAGNGVQVGSSYYYGDGANSAIRQAGGLYIQSVSGGAAAPIQQVGDINSSGNVTAVNAVINANAWVAGTVTTTNAQINGSEQVNGNLGVGGAASVNTTLSIGQGSYMYGGATVYNGMNVASGNINVAGGSITMGDGGQINNSGTQYIESAGNLYLKPWNGNGVTVVGGGGGSGQLVTTGRLTSSEYMIANGGGTVGTGCSQNGLVGKDASGPIFCRNGQWVAPGGLTLKATGSAQNATIGPYDWCFMQATTIGESSAFGTWGVNLISDGGPNNRYFNVYNSKSGGSVGYACF